MNQNEEEGIMLPENQDSLASCVVWTQIPLLSWIVPCLGHVGICDSRGIVYDFQGPYTVGKGHMLFGEPIEKWKIGVDDDTLNQSIHEAIQEFKHRNYSILCSNCHFFVATVLKNANYKQKMCCCCLGNWTFCATLKIALSLVFNGQTIKWGPKICVWAGFIIFWVIIALIIILTKRVI